MGILLKLKLGKWVDVIRRVIGLFPCIKQYKRSVQAWCRAERERVKPMVFKNWVFKICFFTMWSITRTFQKTNLANEYLTALTQGKCLYTSSIFKWLHILIYVVFFKALLRYTLYAICHLTFRFMFSCGLNKPFLSHQMWFQMCGLLVSIVGVW